MRMRSAVTAILSAALLFGSAAAADAAPAAPPPSDVSSAVLGIDFPNEAAAWDFFRARGWTIHQTAGIVGNLDWESGMRPRQHQIGGGPGRGIAQWSVGGRWDTTPQDNVIWFADNHPEGPLQLHLQLEFTKYELAHGYGGPDLRNTTSVVGAVIVFEKQFEICGDCHQSDRVNLAWDALHRNT